MLFIIVPVREFFLKIQKAGFLLDRSLATTHVYRRDILLINFKYRMQWDKWGKERLKSDEFSSFQKTCSDREPDSTEEVILNFYKKLKTLH
jgi:hypothetical protein